MRSKTWLCVMALVSALGLSTAEAEPPEKTVSRFKGLEGYAAFATETDCASSFLELYAIEQTNAQGPGKPEGGHSLAVFYSSYDWCTGESRYGFGETADADIRGSGVASLRARATVPLQVCYYDPMTYQEICVEGIADVDLDWAANGEQSTHGLNTRHASTPSFSLRSHSVGSTATADVTGSLVIDGSDIVPTATWSAGGLSRVREGSIELIRY
jgi:hypothetical protein